MTLKQARKRLDRAKEQGRARVSVPTELLDRLLGTEEGLVELVDRLDRKHPGLIPAE